MEFTIVDGCYVGYHWEGGENFEEAGGVRLSMDSLDNNRPLFLSNSHMSDWDPGIYEPDALLYQIVFKIPPTHPMFTDIDEYMDLTCVKAGFHVVTKKQKRLAGEGYRFFIVGGNPKCHSEEAMLIRPRDWVVSITNITMFVKSMPWIEQCYGQVNS